jgi:hypothetical protein
VAVLLEADASNHSLVDKVEYHVGASWFEGGSVFKTNADENFKLDISAYGSTLCMARVYFKDGTIVSLQRFLDFPDGLPTAPV